MNMTPPRQNFGDLPILLHIKRVYTIIYTAGNKIPKRDKLGIQNKIENLTLTILAQTIDSALRPRHEKISLLQTTRRDIETLKHLIRMEHELNIIPEKTYISISQLLTDISMMANGWLKSLTEKSAL